ncbi:hypothetical protein FJTKL_13265 [Diaporthe vaccinii]|uniref:Uncharacterized protein n=1 Tax=Diaporthe vaccinii TaxID=105482 RepID=A0ABR4EAU8_9PEZI
MLKTRPEIQRRPALTTLNPPFPAWVTFLSILNFCISQSSTVSSSPVFRMPPPTGINNLEQQSLSQVINTALASNGFDMTPDEPAWGPDRARRPDLQYIRCLCQQLHDFPMRTSSYPPEPPRAIITSSHTPQTDLVADMPLHCASAWRVCLAFRWSPYHPVALSA